MIQPVTFNCGSWDTNCHSIITSSTRGWPLLLKRVSLRDHPRIERLQYLLHLMLHLESCMSDFSYIKFLLDDEGLMTVFWVIITFCMSAISMACARIPIALWILWRLLGIVFSDPKGTVTDDLFSGIKTHNLPDVSSTFFLSLVYLAVLLLML